MKKLLTGILCATCLLLSNTRAASSPVTDWDTVSKRFTYNSLTGYELSLFEGFIAAEFPAGKTVRQILTDETSLRNKTRLAQALLFRNRDDDLENAIEILKWVLKNQYTDDQNENFGIWKTAAGNDRLDKNWREFVGCDLIIIYQNYKERLPAEVVSAIRQGLIRAAQGSLKRNVGADYTNIAVMSAFLMDYAGTEFQIEKLKTGGLKKAREVYTLYQKYQTFSEYNSPTYYGVTLIGLALWRELASAQIQQMGKELETSLWNEIASNYNPKLKNLVGPYFRGYGMDMKKYHSISGLWIALALDDARLSPLPRGRGEKEGEMSNISPILHTGLVIQKSLLRQLKEFPDGHFIQRLVWSKVAGDSLKQVTAMVNADWMMGGLWGNRRAWNQIKEGTIHWNNPDGETEWLLLPGEGKTNVRVTEKSMFIFPAGKDCTEIHLYLYAKNLSEKNFRTDEWKFPGIKLAVHTRLKMSLQKITNRDELYKECAIAEEYPGVMKITLRVPSSWNKDEPLIEISPSK